MKNRGILRLLPVLLACVILISCKSGPVVIEDSAGVSGEEAAEETVVVPEDKTAPETISSEDITAKTASVKEGGAETAAREAAAAVVPEGLFAVHFDFDKYTIRDEDKKTLKGNAEWLKARPAAKVTIEGHADERGETEYNLALGEKRAETVKTYLETLGINNQRLSTISFGEEKPADQGHDETSWARNRRAEFKVSD